MSIRLASPTLLLALTLALALGCGPSATAPHGEPDDPLPQGDGWSFATTEGAVCADGSPTGVGFNAGQGDDLVIYLQGGGACWDAPGCVGAVPRATQVRGGYGADQFAGERNLDGIEWLQRSERNPFGDAHLVFVPYCTGDLHAGDNVTRYDGQAFHHVGSSNVRLALRRAAASIDAPDRVFLLGASGGGFGTWYAWEHARSIFPDAEVHVLADSGPPLDVGETLGDTFLVRWDLQLPETCADCADDPPAIVRHIAATAPTTRLGLLTYANDPVLSAYLSLSRDEFATRLEDLIDALDASGGRAFRVPGNNHVVIVNPTVVVDGVDLPAWTRHFVDGDDGWDHVGLD